MSMDGERAQRWWKENFEQPAGLYQMRLRSMHANLGGDAEVDKSASGDSLVAPAGNTAGAEVKRKLKQLVDEEQITG